MIIKKKFVVAALGLALSLGAAQSAFAASEDVSSKDKAAKQAQMSEWKVKTAATKSELQALRTQQKALTEQIKTLHAANKVERKALTADEKAALKQSLAEPANQNKAQHKSIEAIRAQKKALYLQVKTAKQAGNYDAGVAALEQIIELKEQIIQAKQAILVLQQSLQSVLSEANV